VNAAIVAALLIGAPPEEPKVESFGTVDVIHLSSRTPAHIRFRITIDGRSPEAARDAYLTEFFQFLDRNGDGVLNGDEVTRIPAAADLVALLGQTHAGFYTAPAAAAKFEELKLDDKGRVTRAAFLDYYRARMPAVRVDFQSERGRRADAVTDVLFRALADPNGCITKIGAADAEGRLAKYDANDDDLITRDEVADLIAGPAARKRDVFVLPGDAEALNAAAKGLPNFAEGVPGAVLTVRLGRRAAGNADLSLTSSKSAPLSGALRLSDTGHRIDLGAGRFVLRTDPVDDDQVKNARTFLVQQFKAADSKGKGHLDAADAARPQYRFFGPILRIADRDGNGLLSEAELTTWFDLQDIGRRAFATLVVSDEGRDLFALLDTNQDGRLDPREMRTAWPRLAPLDPRGMGSVADIPVWFQKMDRNGDGYVSRKEWLGPPARFAELDRDGDGLIDAFEAEIAAKTKE
jgi:Ca2+-binding EF-hand superfamily protein